VAETVQEIADGRSLSLRNPSGRDGAKMLQWRKSKTDDQWVDLAVATDAEWAADVKRTTGVETKLSLV
jgi:hypothetical protein